MKRHITSIIIALLLVGSLCAQEATVIASPIVLSGSRAPSSIAEPIVAGIPVNPGVKISALDNVILVDAKKKIIPSRVTPLARDGTRLNDANGNITWIEVAFSANASHVFPLSLVTGKRSNGPIYATGEKGTLKLLWRQRILTLDPAKPALLQSLTEGAVELLSGPALEPFYFSHEKKYIKPTKWTLWLDRKDSSGVTLLASTHVGDLLFQLRLQFLANSDDVIVDCRLVNEGPYGHMNTASSHVWFDRFSLSLPKIVGATQVAEPHQSVNSTNWALLQQHVTPYKKGQPSETFPFQVWVNGKPASNGQRHDGVFAVGNEKSSVGYGMTDFWQNAPKAFSIHPNVVLCDLFPDGGNGPEHTGIYGKPGDKNVDVMSLENYRFEGARAKSHRLHLSFSKQPPQPCAKRLHQLVTQPLHVTLSPSALAGRDILGYRVVRPESAASSIRTRFERFAKILVDDSAADSQPALGVIGFPRFIERGGTYGASVFRGWFNFGDIAWGDGYCSLHYDLPFTTLFNYLRTNDPRFLTLGQQMTRHRRDIDQDHDRTSTSNRRGGQFYEKGWFHGNYYHPHASHTWTRGPLLHYLLTGQPWSLEAAELNREFIRRAKPENWNGDWGSRIPGWNVENLVVLYEVMGHKDDLRMARDIIRQFEKLETNTFGGQGFVVNRRMKPKSWKPWMHNIFFNAAAIYRLKTGDKSVDPLLDRMASCFRKLVLRKSASTPWTAARNVVGARRDRPSTNLCWPMAASFSLLGQIQGRAADKKLAQELFADATLHFQERPNAPIAFRVLNYPNSESKIHSGIQLWGLLALGGLPQGK